MRSSIYVLVSLFFFSLRKCCGRLLGMFCVCTCHEHKDRRTNATRTFDGKGQLNHQRKWTCKTGRWPVSSSSNPCRAEKEAEPRQRSRVNA